LENKVQYKVTSECVSCGTCEPMCSHGAIVMKIASPYIITNACVGCGKCAAVCPVNAIIRK